MCYIEFKIAKPSYIWQIEEKLQARFKIQNVVSIPPLNAALLPPELLTCLLKSH